MRAYGDQNMTWQALRDVARGQARYWPDGQVNAVYPNGDGARSFGTITARYPEWLWRYYGLDRRPHHCACAVPVGDPGRRPGCGAPARPATGLLYGLADTDNGDPVYGYDLSVAADTASNVLAVNAMRPGGAAGRPWRATRPRRQTWQARAAQLAAAVNASLRRPDGTYVDGVGAERSARAATPPRRPTRWPSPTASCRPPTWPRSGRTWPSLGIDVGPNHGLELLRGLAAAGMPEAMVHTLTDTSIPGWAHIVAAGGTFTWEVWRPSDLIGDSMSHGWGSSALVAMQETLLGVTFQAPDADGTVRRGHRAAVGRPRPRRGLGADDRRARAVSWQRRGKGMTMALTVPANATATVRLPASAAVERARGRRRGRRRRPA